MEVIQVTGEIWGLETPRKVFWRYPLKAGLGFEWNKFYDSVFILHYMCIFFKHCFLDIPSDAFGEGNGSPLQCFCLENPRDRGAWWAAIYGLAQSRTRLKRLSSSSSMINMIVVWRDCTPVHNTDTCIPTIVIVTKWHAIECSRCTRYCDNPLHILCLIFTPKLLPELITCSLRGKYLSVSDCVLVCWHSVSLN